MSRKRFTLTRRFLNHDIIVIADAATLSNTNQPMIIYNHQVISRPTNMTDAGALKIITNGLPGGTAEGETKCNEIEIRFFDELNSTTYQYQTTKFDKEKK